VKKRREAIEQYEKGGRPELASKEKQEILVLESFLPKPLSAEALEQLVRAAIQEPAPPAKSQMGQVIKLSRPKPPAAPKARSSANWSESFCRSRWQGLTRNSLVHPSFQEPLFQGR